MNYKFNIFYINKKITAEHFNFVKFKIFYKIISLSYNQKMGEMIKIGLFPIKNVLFPETILPLHIFEPRYIKLINQAKNDEITFGINLKNKGKIYEVGCTCKVVDIIKKYADGRFDVLLQGIEKYRIINKEVNEIGYYLADVEILKDIDEKYDELILEKSIELYNEIINHLKDLNISKIEKDKLEISTPSFYIAQKSGFSLNQKYDLLCLNSENARMNFIYEHLQKIFPIIKEAETISKIIKNDGYYIPK